MSFAVSYYVIFLMHLFWLCKRLHYVFLHISHFRQYIFLIILYISHIFVDIARIYFNIFYYFCHFFCCFIFCLMYNIRDCGVTAFIFIIHQKLYYSVRKSISYMEYIFQGIYYGNDNLRHFKKSRCFHRHCITCFKWQ